MQKEIIVHYLRYYPGVWLERLRKTSKGLGQDSCFLGWNVDHVMSLCNSNLCLTVC